LLSLWAAMQQPSVTEFFALESIIWNALPRRYCSRHCIGRHGEKLQIQCQQYRHINMAVRHQAEPLPSRPTKREAAVEKVVAGSSKTRLLTAHCLRGRVSTSEFTRQTDWITFAFKYQEVLSTRAAARHSKGSYSYLKSWGN
jgi:hypothetical protein